MARAHGRRSRAPVASLALLTAIALGLTEGAPSAEQRHTQILVVYSTGRNAPLSMIGDEEIARTLEQGLSVPLDFYAEYIDRGRFPDPAHLTAFEAYLSEKYRGHVFDAVIAIQEVAIGFVAEHRDTLFAGMPIVYLANSTPVPALTNATGVLASLDLGETVSLALALQPDLQQVFVVSGASARDRVYAERAQQQLRPFEQRLRVTYLSGLVTSDLEARLAALPPRSMVYYLLVYEDGAGETFSPLPYLDHLTAIANAPVYCWSDSAMAHGVVGGSMLNPAAMMQAVADLTLRVLRGEAAASISMSSPPGLRVSQVDWRQISRWSIPSLHIPSDTVIRFREPTMWDRYAAYIVGAVVVVMGQAALIAGLLVARSRRRRAEVRARGSEQALRKSYDRIRDLGRRLLNAQESERARIARELHDDISQQLAVLQIDLELLGRATTGAATAMAGEVRKRAQGVASSVHDLSHRLHPAKLRLIGLVAALQGLERELSQPGLTFTHEDVPAVLPLDLTLAVFRVTQEALQNAIKYSQASIMTVHLRGDGDGLHLIIADNGVGFDVGAAWGRGLGLISMTERLEALGGRLDIQSAPGSGTRFEIHVPIGQNRRPSS